MSRTNTLVLLLLFFDLSAVSAVLPLPNQNESTAALIRIQLERDRNGETAIGGLRNQGKLDTTTINSADKATVDRPPLPNDNSRHRTIGVFTIPIFPTFPSADRRDSCVCPHKIKPVCGTDGQISYTYINRCALECSARNNSDLRVDYEGHCCDFSHCASAGPPVCDDRGEVYANLCMFEYRQCVEYRKNNRRHLQIDNSMEKCRCNKPCANVNEPVCDSKGVTHSSGCHLQNAQCVALTKFNINIEVAYQGRCCSEVCLKLRQPFFPLCDSELQTHDNFCAFYVAQCVARKKLNKNLRIVKFGSC